MATRFKCVAAGPGHPEQSLSDPARWSGHYVDSQVLGCFFCVLVKPAAAAPGNASVGPGPRDRWQFGCRYCKQPAGPDWLDGPQSN